MNVPGVNALPPERGQVPAQLNPQPSAPNVVRGPDRAEQASLGRHLSGGGVPQPAQAGGAGSSSRAGCYLNSDAGRSSSSNSGSWSDSLKSIMGGMQDHYAEMQQMMGQPIQAGSFPGAEDLADTLNEALHFQMLSINFEMDMSIGDNVEKNSQKMVSKITDMKD